MLLPLSAVYALSVTIRNWLFDRNILRETRVDVPVVCVGNISAGGVGKTPLVEFLARHFRADKKRVAILSRGYGRRGSGYLVVSNGAQRCAEIELAGDEPSELANALDGVVVAVDENRVRGAKNLIAQFHPDVIILDDGFQHRSLRRDFNIVVMTAGEILEGEQLLPAGNRREPLSGLRRAHCVVITKSRDDAELQKARLQLAERFKGGLYGAATTLQSLRRASTNEVCERGKLAGSKALLFSGIGRPEHFEETLAPLRLRRMGHLKFPDHHWFAQADLAAIEAAYRDEGADAIITTRKDVQRLTSEPAQRFLEDLPVYVASVRLQLSERREIFFNELESTLW